MINNNNGRIQQVVCNCWNKFAEIGLFQ